MFHFLDTSPTEALARARGGRMVTSGPPREVLPAQLIAEVYGVRAEVIHDDRGINVSYLTR